MKKIRWFKCSECKTYFDKLVIDTEFIAECNCNGLANRQLSAPSVPSNTTGRSPSLSNKRF